MYVALWIIVSVTVLVLCLFVAIIWLYMKWRAKALSPYASFPQIDIKGADVSFGKEFWRFSLGSVSVQINAYRLHWTNSTEDKSFTHDEISVFNVTSISLGSDFASRHETVMEAVSSGDLKPSESKHLLIRYQKDKREATYKVPLD